MSTHPPWTPEEIAAILYSENHDLTQTEVLLLSDYVAGKAVAEQAQQALEGLYELRRAA